MRALTGGLLLALLLASPGRARAQVAVNRPFGRAAVAEEWTAELSADEVLESPAALRELSIPGDGFGHSALLDEHGPVHLQSPVPFDDEPAGSPLEHLQAMPVQYPLDDETYEGPDNWKLPAETYNGTAPPLLQSRPPLEDVPLRPLLWTQTRADLSGVIGLSDDLGIISLLVRGSIESPKLPGFRLTPQFGGHVLYGPQVPDIPSQLYDFTLDLTAVYPVNDAWLLQFAIAPGVFTDGKNTSGDALRMVGRGMAFYRWSPQWQLSAGFVYLDREDIAAIPAGGFIYTPDDATRYEVVFPRPRFAKRLAYDGNRERWFYVSGEIGGGSWAVERDFGADDVFTYRDYRVLFGFEYKRQNGVNWFLESGYVFARELEYLSNVGNRSFGITSVVRAGATF